MSKIEDRVRQGARLLDREMPGWAARIDGPSLLMSSVSCCVLGQLYYGDYFTASMLLLGCGRRLHELAASHGFEAAPEPLWRLLFCRQSTFIRRLHLEYDQLRDAWLAEVHARTAGIEAEATTPELAAAAA